MALYVYMAQEIKLARSLSVLHRRSKSRLPLPAHTKKGKKG